MEQPLAVVDANGGPRAAVRVMRETQSAAAFVLSRERRLLGAVHAEPAAKAVREGKADLDGLIDDDVQPVDPNTAVADLFTRCAESPFPVPVADGDGKLLGVIPRVTLLAALGNLTGNNENDEVTADV
jgi:glycine betaine/proline transport system ATP-binding protein